MKKTIALFLAVALLLATAGSAMAADLVWAGWSGEEASTKPMIEKMISDYNAGDSGNKVTWLGWPWGDVAQQLIIRLQGGEPLDVSQLDSSMFSSIFELDACYTVEELFDADFISQLSPVGLDYGTNSNGQHIGVPWTMASIGMVYNPELLSAVGYDAPPTTVEEFEKCCAALKAKDPDIIPYGLSTKDNTATADFMPWLWANGGSLLDGDKPAVNSEAAIATLAWYQKMAKAGYIQSNMSRFDARQLFAQGKIAFYDDAIGCRGVAVSNGVAEDKVDSVIRPMLRPVLKEGDTPTSVMWGHILVVFKNSANPQAAADFIKSILSDENALMYFKGAGMLPVTKSGLENETVKTNEWASTWSSITATGRKNELMINPYSAALSTIVSEEVQAVVVGQKEPAQAAADMESRMLSAMDE